MTEQNGEAGIQSTWNCKSCKQTVSGFGKHFWYLCGDMVIRHRCPLCKARYDRTPTEEEVKLYASAIRPGLKISFKGLFRTRRERSDLMGYQRQFVDALNRVDALSEVARNEGNWRSS